MIFGDWIWIRFRIRSFSLVFFRSVFLSFSQCLCSPTGGPAICSVEYKLVDQPQMNYTSEDKPCARGEIWIRGANVTSGYYKMPEKTYAGGGAMAAVVVAFSFSFSFFPFFSSCCVVWFCLFLFLFLNACQSLSDG
jgi:hypothetical protein